MKTELLNRKQAARHLGWADSGTRIRRLCQVFTPDKIEGDERFFRVATVELWRAVEMPVEQRLEFLLLNMATGPLLRSIETRRDELDADEEYGLKRLPFLMGEVYGISINANGDDAWRLLCRIAHWQGAHNFKPTLGALCNYMIFADGPLSREEKARNQHFFYDYLHGKDTTDGRVLKKWKS